MKLHVRLILITLVIILIASVTTTVIYYNLTGKLLSKNYSQAILNSTNDFVFQFQNTVLTVDDEFAKLTPTLYDFAKIDLNSTSIDFIFTLVSDSLINPDEYKSKPSSFLNVNSASFKQFFVVNPNIVLRYNKLNNSKIYYYGFLISPSILDKWAAKIRSDIALFINNSPVEYSNSAKNQFYLRDIINAVGNLKEKNNLDLYSEEAENVDFFASIYTPNLILTPGGKINFVIFNTFYEGVGFRNTIRTVMFIIVISAGALSLVIVLLFTTRLRKQINILSESAEITRKGNLKHRAQIILKDEIGNLGEAFNKMLDELEKKENQEKEYTEFLTLINQNPTLDEVSNAALHKIIKTTSLTFGVLFILEERDLKPVSTYGLGKDFAKPDHDPNLYNNAIEKKEIVEFCFKDNFPEIKTGLAAIKLKYLLIFPIVYNRETIAILELASESEPVIDVKKYLSTIQDHLAIGLINAFSIKQLENLVSELKRLNDEYQKQNQQIVEQNKQLKELHKEINEKAEELERQRLKAVELTKVKSQFLASMSHELRTPLISILGLTELILKDSSTSPKSFERLNVVHRNGKKLLGLITNILEFSKYESGRIEIKKDNFLLGELIEDIRANFDQLAQEKKLKLIFNLPESVDILVNTDKNKLEQILNNLLLNAFKYTERGEIKLSVIIKENNSLFFSVKDTGIGISKENMQIIFSEFRQVEGIQQTKYGGAGLGLTICKRYVELLGGYISLESELNSGSDFHFELNEVILDIINVSEKKFLNVEQIDLDTEKKQSVTLFCNKNETQKLISDYLSTYDYEVHQTNDHSSGVDIVLNQKSSAVIICADNDTQDLWALIKKIKEQPSLSKLIIILIAVWENEKVSWRPNIFDYLLLPLSKGGIQKSIHEIELFTKAKVSVIHFIGSSNKTFFNQEKSNLERYDVIFSENVGELIQNINTASNQIVLLNYSQLLNEGFDFLLWVGNSKLTKNIFTIILFDKEISQEEKLVLQTKLKNTVIKSKNHPMDILKDLRERMSIDASMVNKRYNLIEDTSKSISAKLIEEETNKIKPTILIVDDDTDTLFTIGEFMKELNYDTLYAHNGTECLLMLNHITPDLILLDIMMPQMDGFETIKRIRSENRFIDLPVIALTAYAMLDNKDVITKNGFSDLVTKPVNSALLSSKINAQLKTSKIIS
jgi:signal transduction histidine kinase/DNA-binding response OmpR family regulator